MSGLALGHELATVTWCTVTMHSKEQSVTVAQAFIPCRQYVQVQGFNFTPKQLQTLKLPIYGVICDNYHPEFGQYFD